jgi:hypothetical protein
MIINYPFPKSRSFDHPIQLLFPEPFVQSSLSDKKHAKTQRRKEMHDNDFSRDVHLTMGLPHCAFSPDFLGIESSVRNDDRRDHSKFNIQNPKFPRLSTIDYRLSTFITFAILNAKNV